VDPVDVVPDRGTDGQVGARQEPGVTLARGRGPRHLDPIRDRIVHFHEGAQTTLNSAGLFQRMQDHGDVGSGGSHTLSTVPSSS
jgi:hypothetical protein